MKYSSSPGITAPTFSLSRISPSTPHFPSSTDSSVRDSSSGNSSIESFTQAYTTKSYTTAQEREANTEDSVIGNQRGDIAIGKSGTASPTSDRVMRDNNESGKPSIQTETEGETLKKWKRSPMMKDG